MGRVRLHLGNPSEIHLINRLDRETSGQIIVAKNRATAAPLRKAWENKQVQKFYLAIVHGHPPDALQRIALPLGPDPESPVAVQDKVVEGGTPAETEIKTIHSFVHQGDPYALLLLSPITGRKHQLRIHLADQGYPIVGDKIYAGDPLAYLNFTRHSLTPEQKKNLILPYHALHAAGVIASDAKVFPMRTWTYPDAFMRCFLKAANQLAKLDEMLFSAFGCSPVTPTPL